MHIKLRKSSVHKNSEIAITGSKSETNRLLLLQALYANIKIKNASNSDDASVMRKALNSLETIKDLHHAGTAMRFLTAYYAAQPDQEVTLTGSARMQERPIKILVEALRQLGADIQYTKDEGFPPLHIKGKKLKGNKVILEATVSSQYISALLLIAPKLPKGLELTLQGTITSVPYIKMTLALLEELGVRSHFKGNTIVVESFPDHDLSKTFTVESDWSSASYFYGIVALSEIGTQITLSSYKQESLQGDARLAEIYKDFGVTTTFDSHKITLKKTKEPEITQVRFDLADAPDIAQTIAVTAFALQISCYLSGLHTLKVKETDRLVALQNELEKLGASVTITNDSIHIEKLVNIAENIAIKTYQDHRMAMAFTPLALRVPIAIEEAEVVSKSYPDFWKDMQQIGITLEEN